MSPKVFSSLSLLGESDSSRPEVDGDVKVEDDLDGEGSEEDENNVDLGDDRITDDEEDIDDEDRKKFSFGVDPLTGRQNLTEKNEICLWINQLRDGI